MSRLVSVAVPVPALDALTYRVPDGLALPAVGARVLVPLGARRLTGIVVAVGAPPAGSDAAPREVKDLVDVIDGAAFLPEQVVGLGRWVGEYYACGPGDALAAAMPPFAWIETEWRVRITPSGEARALRVGRQRATLRDAILAELSGGSWAPLRAIAYRLAHAAGSRRARALPARAAVRSLQSDGLVEVEEVIDGRANAFKTVRIATLTATGADLVGTDRLDRLGPKQRAALTALASAPSGVEVGELRGRAVGADVVGRLEARGLVEIRRERLDRDPFDAPAAVTDSHAGGGDRALTPEQAAALSRLEQLAAPRAFAAALLHGVTGSGKTEVYLRLAAAVGTTGRSTLVLVPEIGLTPALAAAFRGRFGDRVAIQHSGLSDGERHDQWHRIRRGEVDVVVGTRSAVFAPLDKIGLIVVDEEHDGSYKQEESPRYHGRDVAVMRAKREGALVVLGSATPSLESYQNARAGRYELIVLDRRVLDRPLARVMLVNMRDEYAARGPDAVLSGALSEAIGDRLARREQVLVLLNRRGYATAVFCRQCAATIDCPNCSVSLTIHARGEVMRARCHYCNYTAVVPKACPECAAPYLTQTGYGTERVEQEIVKAHPGARVARLDRDTIRRRGAAGALLGRFGAHEIDVLVGTQMIAKGHDFPRVTLVGVISADVGLGMADFRASERTFQLLTQVVGRAGRGEEPGEAIVQTLYPGHYCIRHARSQDYRAFFEEEIAFRRAMLYPPHVALVNGIVRARTMPDAMRDAAAIVQALQGSARAGHFAVLGPAPAPFTKLRGEHRAQFFVKGQRRAAMREAIRRVLDDKAEIRRRTVVDVDPMTVL